MNWESENYRDKLSLLPSRVLIHSQDTSAYEQCRSGSTAILFQHQALIQASIRVLATSGPSTASASALSYIGKAEGIYHSERRQTPVKCTTFGVCIGLKAF